MENRETTNVKFNSKVELNTVSGEEVTEFVVNCIVFCSFPILTTAVEKKQAL